MSVALDEFADKEEGIDGCDAVPNKAGNPFALGGVASLDEQLTPKRRKLLVVVMQLGEEFVLAILYLIKSTIGWGGFLYRKHKNRKLGNSIICSSAGWPGNVPAGAG